MFSIYRNLHVGLGAAWHLQTTLRLQALPGTGGWCSEILSVDMVSIKRSGDPKD